MSDSQLQPIRAKVEAGERLSAADGEYLLSPRVDVHAAGELADMVRRRKCGDAVYYNLNLHINPTNVCIYRCALCAYSRDDDDPRAYTMSDAEIMARAGKRPTPAAPSCTSSAACIRRRRSTGTWG